MNHYVFEWQEKSSLLTIEANRRAQAAGLSQIFHVDFRDYIAFSTNNQAYFYFSKDDIARYENEGKKFLQDGYLNDLLAYTKKLRETFHATIADIDNTDLAAASDDTLLNLFNAYFAITSAIAGIYHASGPEGMHHTGVQLKQYLLNTFTKAEVESFFVALSTPEELDLVQKEKIAWLSLLEQGDLTESTLLDHATSFSAYFFNTYSYQDATTYLKQRAEETDMEELQKEVAEIEPHQREQREKRDTILAELPPNAAALATVLQQMSVDRFDLKEGWQGAEFLALGFFQELSSRIDIPIELFFATYGVDDVRRFLTTGDRLDQAERDKRGVAIYMQTTDGVETRLSGQDAVETIESFFKKDGAEEQSVTGMVAQEGTVQGTARVMLVEDITAFAAQAKKFQKGEILITTMTSPNMIGLMKDAGGVVTNEGGVCSHAAIVSRELGTPCIVGTGNATRVFQTGDVIEVDAINGVVKKIVT